MKVLRLHVARAVRILAMPLLLWAPFAYAVQFSFAALGDTPYNAVEELQFSTMLDEMNAQPLAFVIHVGDFKHARADCSDELFEKRRAQPPQPPAPRSVREPVRGMDARHRDARKRASNVRGETQPVTSRSSL